MYNTHCIVRLIYRYSPSGCRSVETHGYTFFDLHKQTDGLYKLLDDQKNHTNRDQLFTLTICLYTITLTVKVASHLTLALLVLRILGYERAVRSLLLKFLFFSLLLYIHTYIYIYMFFFCD